MLQPSPNPPRRTARKADLALFRGADIEAASRIALRADGSLASAPDARLQRDLCRLANVYELDPVWREHDGQGVSVAVLDTGLMFDHPLLRDAVARRPVPSDPARTRPVCRVFARASLALLGKSSPETEGIEQDCSDRDGHGTHCAGVIAARPVPGLERCRGIAPKVELVIGKVLDDSGEGFLDDVADGIVWAASRADIICLSVVASETNDRLYRAVHAALAAGRTIVCAAGNSGRIPGELAYPARYGGVISVAAHDEFGDAVKFSSRGGEIDFAALGVDVWSAGRDDAGPALVRASGTSIAAPVVAGIAALILAKHRHFDALRAQALLAGNDAEADRFQNATPVRNNEDMRSHLLRIAYSRSGHRDDLGYGPLWPNRLLQA